MGVDHIRETSPKTVEIPSAAPKKPAKIVGFRGFVEDMVEEILLDEKPLDGFKDELRKRCEQEGVDYVNLEVDLEVFLENLEIGIKSPDGLAVAMAMAFALRDAEKCFVSEARIDEITSLWNERHPRANHVVYHNPLPKLEMVTGCEYGGAHIGFGFDVDLTKEEMLSLAIIYFRHEDIRADFENLRKYEEKLYWLIRGLASAALDDEMGENTIKTDRRTSWGDNVKELFKRVLDEEATIL